MVTTYVYDHLIVLRYEPCGESYYALCGSTGTPYCPCCHHQIAGDAIVCRGCKVIFKVHCLSSSGFCRDCARNGEL